MTYQQQVQKAYLAYYGRPADPAGLDFWIGRLTESNGNLSAIIDDFGNSDEANALYGSESVVDRVTKIYGQIFNRTPDEGGLNYWVSKIQNKEVSLSEAALAIQGGAQNDDLLLTVNKVFIANRFTDALSKNSSLNSQYNGEEAASAARDLIKSVKNSQYSILKAMSNVDNATKSNQLLDSISIPIGSVSFGGKVIQGDMHLDLENSLTYAWGKPQGLTYADFDRDGDTDVMFFPSNFTKAVHIPIAVFTNDGNGKFTYAENFIKNESPYEFVRDVVEGDYDGDGDIDYVLLDTGWELDSEVMTRDSNYFFGATVKYLEQTDSGLVMRDLGASTKSFNHTGGQSGDINGDGYLDFVAANFSRNDMNFGVYLGNGNGTFTLNQGAASNVFEYHGGATIIDVNGVDKVVVGSYRGWQKFPSTIDHDVEIFGWSNGKLVFEQTLPRPFDSTYGRNYGAGNMFTQDINGDGRQDLIVAWETEADRFDGSTLGFQDGITAMVNPIFSGAPKIRYGEIGLENKLWAIYEQDANGKFTLTDVMNGTGFGSAVEMRFVDIDRDGDIDMYNNNMGSGFSTWHKNWFINDGNGNFFHPEEFDTNAFNGQWMNDITEFFDANNDGITDAVVLNTIFPGEITRGEPSTHNVGVQLDTYLADSFVPVIGVGSIDATVSQFLPFGG
jgi:hypothetical protein